jgi:hypothetical protein
VSMKTSQKLDEFTLKKKTCTSRSLAKSEKAFRYLYQPGRVYLLFLSNTIAQMITLLLFKKLFSGSTAHSLPLTGFSYLDHGGSKVFSGDTDSN